MPREFIGAVVAPMGGGEGAAEDDVLPPAAQDYVDYWSMRADDAVVAPYAPPADEPPAPSAARTIPAAAPAPVVTTYKLSGPSLADAGAFLPRKK